MSQRAIRLQHPQPRRFNSLLSLGRLFILLILAVSLTFLLAAGNVVTAERLFQSPPAPQPPAEQPQPPAPPPSEQPPAQPEQQPSAASPVDPQAQPPAPPPQEPPAAQPADPQVPTPLAPKPAQPSNTDKEEAPNLTLDTAELIDTVIVSGAYVWFCCGIILFLLIPLTLLILYIRGRSKIVQEEEF
jgi:outer membrane biosynthesis protein TonB